MLGLFPEDATPSLHDSNAEAMRYLLPELERTVKKKLPKLLKTIAEERAGEAVLLLELHGALNPARLCNRSASKEFGD